MKPTAQHCCPTMQHQPPSVHHPASSSLRPAEPPKGLGGRSPCPGVACVAHASTAPVLPPSAAATPFSLGAPAARCAHTHGHAHTHTAPSDPTRASYLHHCALHALENYLRRKVKARRCGARARRPSRHASQGISRLSPPATAKPTHGLSSSLTLSWVRAHCAPLWAACDAPCALAGTTWRSTRAAERVWVPCAQRECPRTPRLRLGP